MALFYVTLVVMHKYQYNVNTLDELPLAGAIRELLIDNVAYFKPMGRPFAADAARAANVYVYLHRR
jgi:hypothetical protein